MGPRGMVRSTTTTWWAFISCKKRTRRQRVMLLLKLCRIRRRFWSRKFTIMKQISEKRISRHQSWLLNLISFKKRIKDFRKSWRYKPTKTIAWRLWMMRGMSSKGKSNNTWIKLKRLIKSSEKLLPSSQRFKPSSLWRNPKVFKEAADSD